MEDNTQTAERKPKKKRSKFVRRIRAAWRRLCALPAKTLVYIGGGIALILIAIILLVIFLPKTDPQQVEEPAAETPVAEETPEVPEMPTFTPEPEAPATPTPHPMEGVGKQGTSGWYLSLNDQADVVADIQKRLVELGYMDMPVIDGVEGPTTTYGPASRLAVQKFQSVNGLELDGCVGMSTYDLLMSENAKGMQLSRGSAKKLFKDDVTKLQTRLNELGYYTGELDGVYSTTTMEAVQAFQGASGLKADGIAGQATLKAIYAE